jgi:hypothetical protein
MSTDVTGYGSQPLNTSSLFSTSPSIDDASSEASGGGTSSSVLQLIDEIEQELEQLFAEVEGNDGASTSPSTSMPSTPASPVPQASNLAETPAVSEKAATPAASTPAASSSAPAPASGSTPVTASVDGGGPNSLTINNTTSQPMQVAFFKNLAPGENPSFNGPDATVTIPPGGSAQVSMPANWQGRAQKWDGSTQDNANWAELNFEPSTGKTWFDESDIPGRNASIKITSDDGQTAGSSKSVLGDAPSDITNTDSSGQKVIDAPQWFTGTTNQQSVNYLDQQIGNSNAYVLPDDNNAVRVSESHHLTIDFGDA